jgi:hypothetical protein
VGVLAEKGGQSAPTPRVFDGILLCIVVFVNCLIHLFQTVV